MTTIQFGKPSAVLRQHKQSFVHENDRFLEEKLSVNRTYVAQPARTTCKNCEAVLGEADFVKHGVGYTFCERCGHLNGCHEDTKVFCEEAYGGSGGSSYATNYAATNRNQYEMRMRDIYVPKVEFLHKALSEAGVSPANLRYADFGAGSGYFVAALRHCGLLESIGYEVSADQVNLGRAMIDAAAMQQHELDATAELAATTTADVVSLIGVLEHLEEPRRVMEALRSNGQVRFIYLSVPLFSPCVAIESAMQEVMPRQLVARHTHLYTESSLDYLCQEFGLERAAEWWFGTDMVDLVRSVAVSMSKNDCTLSERWLGMMEPLIDTLQMAIDRQKLSSEVHMLLRKRS